MPPSRKVIPWFHGEVAKPLFAYFEHLDLPIELYLERHRLPPNYHAIYQGVVPALRLLRFFDDLSHVYGSPMLMHQAQVYNAQQIKLSWQYSQLYEPTLKRALEKTIVQLRGHAYRQFHLVLQPDCAVMTWPTDGLGNSIEAQAGAYSLEVLFDVARQYLGADWTPEHIGVPGRVCGQSCLETAFPQAQFYPLNECWSFPIPRTSLALSPLLQLETPSPSLPAGGSITNAAFSTVCLQILQTYMRSQHGSQARLTMQETADILELRPRTLQRRLKESGMTFSQVYDEACLEQAKTLLQDTPLTIDEISHHLGYGSSSFARSFRRLTGLSPLEYRRTFAM